MIMNVGHELARALRAAYWSMHRRTNAILAAHGVTADQFVLLAALAQEDAITQQELARRAVSDANTIRPMLLTLQNRGLVTRQSHASDGRARCVMLTAKGHRNLSGMMKDTAQCRRLILSAVKHGSARGLTENLTQIAQILESAARHNSCQLGSGRACVRGRHCLRRDLHGTTH
jgi:DNA-binding MarR family transcriptional regulator